MVRWFLLQPFVAFLALGAAISCGEKKSDDAGDPGGSAGMTAGGTGGISDTAGSAGMTGSGGSSAGSGASAGTAGGGGMAGGFIFDPQPTCMSPAVACNGVCLDPGATANGCTYLTQVQSLDGVAVSDGDVFVSTSFPFVPEVETLPSGLYRIDGDTLALTALDTNSALGVTSIAVAGGTVYYLKPGTFSDGYVRSVPATGGIPAELVIESEDGRDLMVIGERVYFAAVLAGSANPMFQTMNWFPVAGGEPQATELTSVNRARASQTLMVASWNGNIKTAPLPDLAPMTVVMGDFELPMGQWWIDGEFVYWNNDGAYKRSPLSAVGASEEQGEFVTAIPAGMTIARDARNELLLSAAGTDATGIYTMPISGGAPELVGVVGGPGGNLWTADATHVFVQRGVGLLRLARPR